MFFSGVGMGDQHENLYVSGGNQDYEVSVEIKSCPGNRGKSLLFYFARDSMFSQCFENLSEAKSKYKRTIYLVE